MVDYNAYEKIIEPQTIQPGDEVVTKQYPTAQAACLTVAATSPDVTRIVRWYDSVGNVFEEPMTSLQTKVKLRAFDVVLKNETQAPLETGLTIYMYYG